jgi:hypothetical protein
VAVLLLPALARWRAGLVATLTVTVMETELVVLIFYLMDVYRRFPIRGPPAVGGECWSDALDAPMQA